MPTKKHSASPRASSSSSSSLLVTERKGDGERKTAIVTRRDVNFVKVGRTTSTLSRKSTKEEDDDDADYGDNVEEKGSRLFIRSVGGRTSERSGRFNGAERGARTLRARQRRGLVEFPALTTPIGSPCGSISIPGRPIAPRRSSGTRVPATGRALNEREFRAR